MTDKSARQIVQEAAEVARKDFGNKSKSHEVIVDEFLGVLMKHESTRHLVKANSPQLLLEAADRSPNNFERILDGFITLSSE